MDPIGQRDIEGYRALTIASADGELEAAFVPKAGMVCCSLRHRGEEILGQRNGLSAYVERKSTMGIPLLYPWANRLSRDRFDIDGVAVDLSGNHDRLKRDQNGLPIHGLVAALEGWEVARHYAGDGGGLLTATLEWERDPQLRALFPFPHRLSLEAAISVSGLEIAVVVEPQAGAAVPIAFGFHPYLALPGLDRSRWHLELPLAQQLELDPGGIPTGSRHAIEPESGRLGDRGFDDLFEAPPPGEALSVSGGGRRIAMTMGPSYAYAQIYAPPGQQLIALEPMTAPTDALTSSTPPLVSDRFRASFSIAVGDG